MEEEFGVGACRITVVMMRYWDHAFYSGASVRGKECWRRDLGRIWGSKFGKYEPDMKIWTIEVWGYKRGQSVDKSLEVKSSRYINGSGHKFAESSSRCKFGRAQF